MSDRRNTFLGLLISSLLFTSSLAASPVVNSTDAKCPDNNGDGIVTSNGTYIVECGIDRSDDDFGAVYTQSYGECVDLCASTKNCLQVSYKPFSADSGVCYMKSGHGYANPDPSIWGARQDDGSSSKISSCPESDGSMYRAYGKIFQVECGVDRRGGDISEPIYTNFVGCVEACAAHSDCVDVTLSGRACYLKSNLTTPVFDPAFWGAQIIGTYDGQATKVSTTFVAPLPTASGARCPDQNGTIVTGQCGSKYEVECGKDYYGNDLTAPRYVYSLNACIQECDKNPGCVDVSWNPGNPGPCYLKSAIGPASESTDSESIWGARQLTGCAATPTTSASSTPTPTL